MLKPNLLLPRLLGTLCVFILSSTTWADVKTSKEFDHYIVHHSIFNSMFILPEIAKIHGITRAKDRALINISVHKKSDHASTPAIITGTAKNLMQQMKTLNFKTISEPGATYYIASLRTSDREVFHFDIQIQPEGSTETLTVKLTQKLWKD